MPIQLASFLLPKNGNTYFLLEDIYLKGGFQVRPTYVARDAIPAINRKPGMLVLVLEDRSYWSLDDDAVTWTKASLGGGSSGGGRIGSWSHSTDMLQPNDAIVVEMPNVGKTVVLQDLELSVPLTVDIYGNKELLDTNPYTFIATDSHLADDGTTLMGDGSEYKNRRYSILVNDQKPDRTTSFWVRLTNSTMVATAVTVNLNYLVLEE